jgi:acyl-CoA reductase-like NAD-dependent aldehyde dehydrogenase
MFECPLLVSASLLLEDYEPDPAVGSMSPTLGSDGRAQRVARKIRAGQVRVNAGGYFGGAPFGGYKQSGLGREHGTYGLEEFLEVKALFI